MSLMPEGWDPIVFPEIRAGLVALWKAAYGSTTDTDSETPDGLEIDIIAAQLMLAFDTDTQLWADSFFRSSRGQALGNILDMFGKLRDPASASSGSAVFYGTAGTAVPIDTNVLTDDQAANRFDTDIATTVGASGNSDAWVVRVKLNAGVVETGETYTVTVDANPPVDYLAVGGDTTTSIATELRDGLNTQGASTAALAGLDDDGSALLVVEVVGGPGDVVASTTFGTPALVIDDLEAVRAAVTATTNGALLAPAGTLQDLANPIAGIVGVSNDVDVTPGRAEQSDDDFRAEHLETLFSNAARTDAGMRASVASVAGVLENTVVSNRTITPIDTLGRPIGSVENIIRTDGTVADAEIANAVARQIPAGIEPYGLRSFGLGTTPDGEVVEIFATDVEDRFLHLSITITAGQGFPVGDITGTVATAVANYYDAGLIQTVSGEATDPTAILVIGKNMTRESCRTPINSVTNNAATTIVVLTDTTATPGAAPVFVAADQFASDRQIILADASRISVVVV